MKVAIPTETEKGLRDNVSDVFSRAPTFTIITITNGNIEDVHVIKNKAAEMDQGAGPLAARTLKENGVDLILSRDLGPGARNILETIEIKIGSAEPGQKVNDTIDAWIKELDT